MNIKQKIRQYSIIWSSVFILFAISNSLFAQDDKSSIVLYNTNVEITYHQPFRNGYKSSHPSYIEVPKLNHILNILQNYVQYLKRLERITGTPNIRISYAPDSVLEEDEQQTRIININDLNFATILRKVNRFITEYGYVKPEDIIDSAEAIQSLPEQEITKNSNFSKSAYFNNISLAIKSNEPDTSYSILDNQTVFTTRPSKKTNQIYKLSIKENQNDSGVYSEEAKVWYQYLLISNDNKYLAYTDGLVPQMMDLTTKESFELFPNSKNITLLDYVWSPTQNLLAGMILDEKKENRSAFIYDAEKRLMLNTGNFQNVFSSNYLYATPVWSQNGEKLVFISSKSINLIDLKNNKAIANLVNVEGEIGEFTWSEDANSFAFIEVKGQSRNQYHFDDYDLKGCVLHRYRFVDSIVNVAEDYAQCIESRNTIKIVSFTDKDQILYLEGRLVAPEVPSSYWDLSKTFKAFLTPLPTEILNTNNLTKEKVKPQQLPMQYLYVYRSLDSKNANIYDSGSGHSNLLYTEDFYSNWFIGLYLQGGISYKGNVYNYRNSPYPFQCNNYAYFMDKTKGQVSLLMKFLKDYNIRSTDSDSYQKTVFMHVNFTGILNIWSIKSSDFFEYIINGDKVREDTKEEVATSNTIASQTNTNFGGNSFDESNKTE